jgi:hypothetical protein
MKSHALIFLAILLATSVGHAEGTILLKYSPVTADQLARSKTTEAYGGNWTVQLPDAYYLGLVFTRISAMKVISKEYLWNRQIAADHNLHYSFHLDHGENGLRLKSLIGFTRLVSDGSDSEWISRIAQLPKAGNFGKRCSGAIEFKIDTPARLCSWESHDTEDTFTIDVIFTKDSKFVTMTSSEDVQSQRSTKEAQQAGAGQPATRPESKSKSGDKPQPEAEGRSR